MVDLCAKIRNIGPFLSDATADMFTRISLMCCL